MLSWAQARSIPVRLIPVTPSSKPSLRAVAWLPKPPEADLAIGLPAAKDATMDDERIERLMKKLLDPVMPMSRPGLLTELRNLRFPALETFHGYWRHDPGHSRFTESWTWIPDEDRKKTP